MADLAERLRIEAECDVLETARDGTFERRDAERWAAIMYEAADEIERLAPLSPDEGVRAAQIDAMFDRFLERYEACDAPVSANDLADYLGDVRDAVRAALSTPVPEEGLPRGSASAAALHYRPNKFDDWGVIRDASGDLFAVVRRPLDEEEAAQHRQNGTDPFEALARGLMAALASAEPGAGAASDLPSPLPLQGEPVAWRWKVPMPPQIPGSGFTWEFAVHWSTPPKNVEVQPLYTAEALAAERARAAERIAEIEDDVKRLHGEKMEHFEARLAAEARADRAEEALRQVGDQHRTMPFLESHDADALHGRLLRAREIADAILKETAHDA